MSSKPPLNLQILKERLHFFDDNKSSLLNNKKTMVRFICGKESLVNLYFSNTNKDIYFQNEVENSSYFGEGSLFLLTYQVICCYPSSHGISCLTGTE